MSGEVPLGWEASKLRDLATHVTDKWEPGDAGHYRYLGLEHIDQGTGKILEVGSSEGLASLKTRFLPGDVLFGKLRPNLRKTALPDFDGIASTDIIALRAKRSVDPRFLFYTASSDPCINHAVRSAAGTKMPRTSWALLGDYEVALPPLAEQRRIAEILSSVDEAIQATQAVIEQTRKVKDGVLQRLLTKGIGHTHFKVSDAGLLPQSWKVVRIAEVATAKGGKRMPKGRPFASEPTPYPYIRVSDLKNGTISSSNLMYVLPEDQKEIKSYTIASNDVYISIAGTIGLSGTIPPELDGAQLTENAAKLVIKNQRELDHEFLARLMQSETIQRQIVSAKGIGGGVPKLALFRIEQMFIPLPPIDEQIEILKFARVIDAEIESQENILSRVLSIKSALVSDLLTGRRRVSASLPLAAE